MPAPSIPLIPIVKNFRQICHVAIVCKRMHSVGHGYDFKAAFTLRNARLHRKTSMARRLEDAGRNSRDLSIAAASFA